MEKIDRIEPSNRPNHANAGTQTWRNLLFVHWPIAIEDLRALVPQELEIDSFDGQAFVGLVPFQMLNIRPSWLPRQLAFNFLETNVRTYVVHQGRPGVYFFSLDANSRLAVMAARYGWSLPYVYARMQMQSQQSQGRFSYSSVRPDGSGSSQVSFSVGQHLGVSQPGTLDHFLFERFLLFLLKRQQVYVGQVHHVAYDVHQAQIETLDQSLMESAGLHCLSDNFKLSQNCPGLLSHYCPGVDVEVFAIAPVSPDC